MSKSAGQGAASSSLDPAEVSKFSEQSSQWWSSSFSSSKHGAAKRNPLREMNPCRVSYMLSAMKKEGIIEGSAASPDGSAEAVDVEPLSRADRRWLEVGPGGGILVESLLRLGQPPGKLVAVEPSLSLCETIRDRLERAKMPQIGTFNGTVEDYRNSSSSSSENGNNGGGEKKLNYDVVSMLEVIEHVQPGASRASLVSALLSLTAPNGLLFISTIDRELVTGYLRAIFCAEYLAGVTPVGTHRFDRLLRPWELGDLIMREAEGLGYKMSVVNVSKMTVEGGWLGEVSGGVLCGDLPAAARISRSAARICKTRRGTIGDRQQ